MKNRSMSAGGSRNSAAGHDCSGAANASMLAADDDAATRPPWGGVGRVGTLAAIAAMSKLYLNLLNSTTIAGEEAFHKAVLERNPEQGLITVSNHTRWGESVSGMYARAAYPANMRAPLWTNWPRHSQGSAVASSPTACELPPDDARPWWPPFNT